jgi:elongation factor 2
MYASKFKIEVPKMMDRMWGNQYYNATTKKWNKTGGDGYIRGYVQFILQPIYMLFDAVMKFDKEKVRARPLRSFVCSVFATTTDFCASI